MHCTCGRTMKEAEIEFHGFKVRGYKCECGEETLNPIDVETIRRAVNEPVKARKVAHSLVITLPKPLARLAKIRAGDKLKWRTTKNQLVLAREA